VTAVAREPSVSLAKKRRLEDALQGTLNRRWRLKRRRLGYETQLLAGRRVIDTKETPSRGEGRLSAATEGWLKKKVRMETCNISNRNFSGKGGTTGILQTPEAG